MKSFRKRRRKKGKYTEEKEAFPHFFYPLATSHDDSRERKKTLWLLLLFGHFLRRFVPFALPSTVEEDGEKGKKRSLTVCLMLRASSTSWCRPKHLYCSSSRIQIQIRFFFLSARLRSVHQRTNSGQTQMDKSSPLPLPREMTRKKKKEKEKDHTRTHAAARNWPPSNLSPLVASLDVILWAYCVFQPPGQLANRSIPIFPFR